MAGTITYVYVPRNTRTFRYSTAVSSTPKIRVDHCACNFQRIPRESTTYYYTPFVSGSSSSPPSRLMHLHRRHLRLIHLHHLTVSISLSCSSPLSLLSSGKRKLRLNVPACFRRISSVSYGILLGRRRFRFEVGIKPVNLVGCDQRSEMCRLSTSTHVHHLSVRCELFLLLPFAL